MSSPTSSSSVFVLFAGIACCISAGAIGCDESCDTMTTESYLMSDLGYVQSEVEAVSRANAEAWSSRDGDADASSEDVDASTASTGSTTTPVRTNAALSSYGGTFDPARPCDAGLCVHIWNDYATFNFTRPAAVGTYALEDLQAKLCEHGSVCPTVEEMAAGAMCDYSVERCVEVRGKIVVERHDPSCGQDACGGFVADLEVHTLDPNGPTITGKTRLISVEKIVHGSCGGGGCGGGAMNPMR